MPSRRTIRETVEAGINTVAELQGSLLTAIQLEFSTIPPYLCAQWSINSDPSDVSDMIQGVVVQEMLHFGLACNMYTATGGSLSGEIATSGFLPQYPTNLPGDVHPGLSVALLPLGNLALQTFMSIEYPEVTLVVQQPTSPAPPSAPSPPTIGQFYQTIAAGFNTVFPSGLPTNPSLNQVVTSVGADQLFAINTVADAASAILEITDQGEGTSTSPDEGTFDSTDLAHYYTFAQIYYGATVAPVGGTFTYSGESITLPTVYDFASEPPGSPDQKSFISTFTTLMTQLESCWTGGASIETAIGTMYTLQSDGVTLIQAGSTPQFRFEAGSALPASR